MYYKISGFLFLIFAVHCSALGQKIVPSPDDLYSDAMEYMLSGDYHEALYPLLELESRGYHSAGFCYKLGECFLNAPGQKFRALPYLKNAVQSISDQYQGDTLDEPVAPPKALLYLGIAFRLNADFKNALVYLNQYRDHLAATDIDNIHLADYHIERCNNAVELMAAPAVIKVDTLSEPVNNSVSYNPLVTADEKLIYYNQEFKFYDAVMRSVKIEDNWTSSENITSQVKSDGDHFLTGVSADGTRLFFTFYDLYRTGDIYSSIFNEGLWSEVSRLDEPVNSQFNETHASLSPEGDELYFTSDRKGGFGGMDIYKAHLNSNGQWEKVVNLGPSVNTPYNEETPFVSADGNVLFFSSQGHYNMGGYDIFYSKKGQNGNWLPPVNLGYPINDTDDDLFYFPLDSGNIAYQSRFHRNSADRDIVKITVLEYGKPARFRITGKMDVAADSGFNASAIEVAFIQADHDTVARNALNNEGEFSQKLAYGNYQIRFEHENSDILTKNISIPENSPHNTLFIQDKLVITPRVVFDSITIRDIRFEFDRFVIDDDFIAVLDAVVQLMKEYPGVIVRANGFADAIGKDSYNMKLSMERAMMVKDYIENRLGSTDRIEVKAFGEQKPVAVNQDANGKDLPEGRKYNRRVEVEILNVPENVIVIRLNDIPQTFVIK